MSQTEIFIEGLRQHSDLIVDGLVKTLVLFAAISVTGFLFGLWLFYLRTQPKRSIQSFAQAFISFFVGTPLIVLLFLAYYGLPQLGVSISPFAVALIGFTFNVGSYNAYYLYGAYQGIRREELEAAQSQGFASHQVFTHIVLPQTLRMAVPALSNQVVRNLKDTSLVFLIQYVEFFARMQELASSNFLFFEAYFFTCAVYALLVGVLSLCSKWIEKRAAF